MNNMQSAAAMRYGLVASALVLLLPYAAAHAATLRTFGTTTSPNYIDVTLWRDGVIVPPWSRSPLQDSNATSTTDGQDGTQGAQGGIVITPDATSTVQTINTPSTSGGGGAGNNGGATSGSGGDGGTGGQGGTVTTGGSSSIVSVVVDVNRTDIVLRFGR